MNCASSEAVDDGQLVERLAKLAGVDVGAGEGTLNDRDLIGAKGCLGAPDAIPRLPIAAVIGSSRAPAGDIIWAAAWCSVVAGQGLDIGLVCVGGRALVPVDLAGDEELADRIVAGVSCDDDRKAGVRAFDRFETVGQ